MTKTQFGKEKMMALTLVKQLEIAWSTLSDSDKPDDEIRIAALDELIALLFSEVWDGKKESPLLRRISTSQIRKSVISWVFLFPPSEATVSWHPESSLSWLVAIL